LERGIAAYFKAKDGRGWRAIGLVAVFSILFLSKFAILELVDVVFGDHVELGHFVEIVLIILTMLIASAVLHFVFRKLGRDGAP
jgi:hypothetical protein